MSLTIAQILHTYGCRSDTHSLFDTSKLPDNPYVTAAVAGTLALQVLPLILPGLKGLLDLAAIGLADSLVIAVAAIAPLLLNEVTKYFGPSLQK
jgi:Ca2+-transporting ATPase